MKIADLRVVNVNTEFLATSVIVKLKIKKL